MQITLNRSLLGSLNPQDMISQVNIYMMDIVWICVEVFMSCFCVKVKVQWRGIWFCKASLRISHTCLFQSKGSWILKNNSLKLTYSLKLVSAIFLSIFYFFTKWWPFKNYEDYFLFHLKTSFLSRDVQVFIFLSLPVNTFQTQTKKWKSINLWCHELACINL